MVFRLIVIKRLKNRLKIPVCYFVKSSSLIHQKIPTNQHGNIVWSIGKKFWRGWCGGALSFVFNSPEYENCKQCLGSIEILEDIFIEFPKVFLTTKLGLMGPFSPDCKNWLRKDWTCDNIWPPAAFFPLTLVSVAKVRDPDLKLLLHFIVGPQITQIHRVLAVCRVGDVLDKIPMGIGELVNANHHIGGFANHIWQIPVQCFLNCFTGLTAIDNLHVLELHFVIWFLKGIVIKLVAYDSDAIIVKIEFIWPGWITKCPMNRCIYTIGVQSEVAANVAF